jgi:hypothetical protein
MNERSSVIEHNDLARRLLESAAGHARIAVFCGIPGVGKSRLLGEQQALALAAGRRVTRLAWDVARQAFEMPAILSRYPEIDGSTHVMIRRAVGLWVRPAIERWHASHPSRGDMLLVEAPLVGGRFTELAQSCDDGAEPLLNAPQTRFYVPTPTTVVRLAIEAARRAEALANRHVRDAANASPQVVDELWRMVGRTAKDLGLCSAADVPYSPDLYYAVYAAVLRHRRVERLPIEMAVASHRSPHALVTPTEELCPSAAEALDLVARAEAEGADRIAARAQNWYRS